MNKTNKHKQSLENMKKIRLCRFSIAFFVLAFLIFLTTTLVFCLYPIFFTTYKYKNNNSNYSVKLHINKTYQIYKNNILVESGNFEIIHVYNEKTGSYDIDQIDFKNCCGKIENKIIYKTCGEYDYDSDIGLEKYFAMTPNLNFLRNIFCIMITFTISSFISIILSILYCKNLK